MRQLSYLILLAFFCSCSGRQVDVGSDGIPAPPKPFNGHLCDTLKSRTRQKIFDNSIEILFDDTFSDATWGEKRYYLDSILNHGFHLHHVPLFNNDFRNCVQSVMDSFLNAKFGRDFKESVINEAYRITEITYFHAHEKNDK